MRDWMEIFGPGSRESYPFDRIYMLVVIALFLAVELTVLLDYSILGDMAVESDFLAEIAPAARNLLEGRFDLADYPFKGPVSAAVVALVHMITGPWGLDLFRTGHLVSLAAAAVVLFFTYRLGLALWGRRTAVAAVLLVAVNKLFFINAHKAGSDLLFLALAMAVLWLILAGPATRNRLILAGALAGLAFLTRYVGLALPVWAAGVVWWNARQGRRQSLEQAAWIVAGFGVVVTPWLMVNLVQAGALLGTNNLQNVVAHIGVEEPPGGFPSLGALVAHDPALFLTRYLAGLPKWLWSDQDQVLGWAMTICTVAGFAALFFRGRERGRLALVAWGAVYLVTVGLVFYVARFSLPLLPVWVLLAASLTDRLPRKTPLLAVALLAFTVYWQIDYTRTAVAFYRAEQPLYLQKSFGILKDEAARHRGEDQPMVMARKPHAAWYGDMRYVAYPGALTGSADLLAYAAESGAEYLVAGLIEHRFFQHSGFLEHLDDYRGVEKIFQADGNIVYRLDRRQAGPVFGTRGEIEDLWRVWDHSLAVNDTTTVMATGSRLIALLDEDGRFAEARDVAGLKIAYAGGRDVLITRLNLAWVSLKLEDSSAGVSALAGHLTRDGTRERDVLVAKGRTFLGQLHNQAGDVDEALENLGMALELYRELGMEKEAAPLREFIGRMQD